MERILIATMIESPGSVRLFYASCYLGPLVIELRATDGAILDTYDGLIAVPRLAAAVSSDDLGRIAFGFGVFMTRYTSKRQTSIRANLPRLDELRTMSEQDAREARHYAPAGCERTALWLEARAIARLAASEMRPKATPRIHAAEAAMTILEDGCDLAMAAGLMAAIPEDR